MTNEEIKKNYSLKVLFGPMFGCELHLPANDYFLIINSAPALLDKTTELESNYEHAASYTADTLYIPCDLISPNIMLHLSNYHHDDEGIYFDIEIFDENGKNYKSVVRENDLFIHEHIRLAVKSSDEEWSDSIKNYHSLTPITDLKDDEYRKDNKKRWAKILASFLIITTLSAMSIFTYYKISADQQVVSLSEALSGSPLPLEIVKSRDNKNIYILAQKSREMEWAKEAIHKMKNQDNLSLILLSKNKVEIIDELSKMGYPVLQFDYRSPKHPILALYRSLTPNEENSLKNLVLKKIPYAEDVNFIIRTKAQLLSDAKQGLDRLNIHYKLINTALGYSLVIRDSLSDNSLNSLQEFINEFNIKWGDKVITFSINLDENWLQNKSYVDSPRGYLFLNPRHWYFPLNNKDF